MTYLKRDDAMRSPLLCLILGFALLMPLSAAAQQLPASAQFENRLSDLEEALRAATGKIEELEHQNDQLKSQIENLQKDLELRITELATKPEIPSVAAEPVATPATTATTTKAAAPAAAGDGTRTIGTVKATGKEPAKSATPQQEYDDAFALLRQNKYDDAINAFNAFLQKYPENDLSGNVYFWVGEAYYVQENFEKASLQYARGFQNFPKGNKAADSLLKLALSLEKMSKKTEACTTLDKLSREFPNLKGTVRKKADESRKSLKCS